MGRRSKELFLRHPSFSGETGAYQATAIALASDILGSAVTAVTYIRHKNIDLKRGWIMLVCILGMCTMGSFAAWKAGNVEARRWYEKEAYVSVQIEETQWAMLIEFGRKQGLLFSFLNSGL